MATFSQKDIQLLFVGAAATKTTGGIDTLNNGEIGLFTPSGTRLTEASAATAEQFIIVQGRGTAGVDIVSGIIKKANIKKATRKAYVAATEQVDTIGFTGTTGSGGITVTNDNLYGIRINLNQGLTSNHGGLYLKHGFFLADATATQAEIAAGLHASLVANFSREADRLIKFERIIDSGLTTLAETYSPKLGSKFVAASGAVTATVGQAIRFGTALTDGTYIVTAIDAVNNIVTLDVPYQGTTGSALTTESGSVTADWGIRLTGVAQPFTTGKMRYQKISWKATLENFGATVLTNLTGASLGSGEENAVKELEFFLQGNEGDFYRTPEPYVFPSRALVSGNYDLIDLEIEELYTGSITMGPIHKVYTLAIPQTAPNYAVTATADDITDVLEVLVYGSTTGTLNVT